MKKFIILFLVMCLSLSLCACGSSDEDNTIATPHEFGNGLWYHVYEDQTSLQVLLEANPTTGYVWNYQISDPEILAVTFFSYAADDSEGNTGTGGVFGGSFMPTGEKSGTVTITFRHMRPWEDTPIEIRTLTLKVNGEGLISVSSAEVGK